MFYKNIVLIIYHKQALNKQTSFKILSTCSLISTSTHLWQSFYILYNEYINNIVCKLKIWMKISFKHSRTETILVMHSFYGFTYLFSQFIKNLKAINALGHIYNFLSADIYIFCIYPQNRCPVMVLCSWWYIYIESRVFSYLYPEPTKYTKLPRGPCSLRPQAKSLLRFLILTLL